MRFRIASTDASALAGLVLGLLVTGCFDPTTVDQDTETDGTTTAPTSSATDGGMCSAGMSQACTCDDGSAGTQTCGADGTFGACTCNGTDDSTTDPTDPSTTTGPPPQCEIDEECLKMGDGVCETDRCIGGECVIVPDDEGTPCGDPTRDACNAADTCDGNGECLDNFAPNANGCEGCPLGVCACNDGACADCPAFAPENNFVTARSIEGWSLSGGWGLYRAAPQNQIDGERLFDSQVFGTDGNRAPPYPGGEVEVSSATTAPTVLPNSLQMLSWHVDEGSGSFDNKTIEVSTNGGASFQVVASCAVNPMLPFCAYRDDTRDISDWDTLDIPLPPGMPGQVGLVRFSYDSGDSCCQFERGWFLDRLNFATECACADDANCADLGGDCGAAVCDGDGECGFAPEAVGTACGDATDVECNAPDACDGAGYCLENQAATGLTFCGDCPGGVGACHSCQDGACLDCMDQPAVNDFANTTVAINGWTIEDLSPGGGGADWAIYFEAPPNQNAGSVPVPLSFSPSFGTDGNRQAPYVQSPTPGNLEHEFSRVTSPPDVIPANLTFQSWNVDEGATDNKIIEVSVDDGMTWNGLVNCNGNPQGQPFCNFVSDGRAGNAWDAITIPTGAFAGMVGRVRITYNTQDACCNFERGWFIDNLNFAQYCNDPQFP